VIHNYWVHKDKMIASKLYQVLDAMPKGGLLHLHTTAAPSAKFYLDLTHEDCVYYNDREKLFKVQPVRPLRVICAERRALGRWVY